jgi:hypothetical protein
MYSLNQQDIRYFNRYNQGKTSKKTYIFIDVEITELYGRRSYSKF